MNTSRFSIILPVHNQANQLTRMLSELLECFRGAELIVVDNHSTDSTYGTVLDLMPRYPRLHLMTAREGLGASIRSAVGGASEEFILVVMDPLLSIWPLLIMAETSQQPGAADIIAGVRRRQRPAAWHDAALTYGIRRSRATPGMQDAYPPVLLFKRIEWTRTVLQQVNTAVCFEFLTRAIRRRATVEWHLIASDLDMPREAAIPILNRVLRGLPANC